MNTNTNLNTNNSVYKERLKFYANTPKGEKNKYFCFNVSLLQLEESIFRFIKRGYYIKSAWYECINTETGEILENSRITLQDVFDKFSKLTPSQIKKL